MSRLNIPLGNTPTTRRSRRVVWLLALPPLAVWVAVSWWLGRPTIGRIAPEGTEAVIRLRPSGAEWNEILDTIGGWPAVSGRGLTVRDLAGYAQGELALFLKGDGTWDAGIRHGSGDLPQALLDAEGIYLQSEGDGLYLLSARTESVIPVSLHAPSPWVRSLRGHTLGEVYVKNGRAWIAGRLESQSFGWDIRLPAIPGPKPIWKRLPEGTIAFLSTPAWTDNVDVSGVTGRMDAVLKTFDVAPLRDLADKLLSGPGSVVLTSDQNGLGVLLSGPASALSEDQGKRLLAASVALQAPTTTRWQLEDQTVAQELNVDPSGVSIEEKTVHGVPVQQASVRQGLSFLFSHTDKGYAFANRDQLMAAWLDAKGPQTKAGDTCQESPAAYLDVHALFAISADSLASQEPNVLRLMAERFEHIAVHDSRFSTEILLCR